MSKNWTKSVCIVFVAVLGLAAGAGAARASCGSAPIQHGLGATSFEQCGPNAAAFVWFHGRGVQRIIGDFLTAGNTPAGHDSGSNQTLADSIFLEGPNGAVNGSYIGITDFANPGWDGCILNIPENPLGCAGGADFGVLDYVISGVDPLAPNVARIAVLSVDFNEFFQAHILDNAGAPAVDGDACGIGDPLSFLQVPVNCAPIPAPTLVSSTGDDLGINVTLGLGDTSSIAILDDCAIAETRSTNCPRNLYAGRALVYKRGTCDPGEVSTFDRRVYLYPAIPPPGITTIDANWRMFSPEDQNYNDVLDPGEDGSNGGMVNGQLDRIVAGGTSPTTVSFRASRVLDGLNCLYFGMAIGLDANHLSINPPTNTLFGELALSPMVSINPVPIGIAGAVGPSDIITQLTALKVPGGVKVEWVTFNERMTAGFDVIGIKKIGREFHLNPTLIPATEGTTGNGASYSVTFDSGQLKGCNSIAVELVLTDGSRTQYGPVPF